MQNKTNTATGGIGIFGALGLLFIGLKLTGYISWGWFYVLLPLTGPFMIVLAILALLLIAKGADMTVDYINSKRRATKNGNKA